MAKITNTPDAIQALLAAVDRHIAEAAKAKEAVDALRRLAAEDVRRGRDKVAERLRRNGELADSLRRGGSSR